MTNRQFGELEAGDVGVIVGYFALLLAVGFWTICKAQSNLSGFFLAGRSMTWWPIGMSLFASNIGSVNFVGIAGSGAASGLSVVMFEWNAVWLLILLGWVFLPVYISSGIYTMPEYLQWRFGGSRLRIYLSVVAILTYIFATVSTDLYSGALFINQTLGWNIYAGVGLLLGIALVFSALGGLETVILTDALAVVVMVLGGSVLMIVGFVRVGGITALEHKYMRAVSDFALNASIYTNSTCGFPREDAWHIFRDIDKADYPWLGTVLRTTFGSLWYWCANQVLVQRALAAKNITHAKAGTLLAGYLKLLPMFLMVFPGMISRVLFPKNAEAQENDADAYVVRVDEVACADPDTCMEVCGTSVGCSNIALPRLVTELLPEGIRGLLVAAMMAAVVSSLTSILNSSTTLFTMDIYNKIRPVASEWELLLVGRIFVVVLTGLSIVWIPLMQNQSGGEIFRYATTITGYMGAPTCAMFVLAMFWPRCNEQGAFWGMLIAQLWGITRFILGFIYTDPACGENDTRPSFIANFHPYYHTVSQVAMAFVIAAVISLLTEPVSKERLAGLTFWTRGKKPLKDVQYEQLVKERAAMERETMVLSVDDEAEKEVVIIRSKTSIIKKRIMSTLCGTSDKKNNSENDYTILEPHSVRMRNLRQSKFWKYFLNSQMIILMAVTAFFFGWWH